jgi:hypothetical protein
MPFFAAVLTPRCASACCLPAACARARRVRLRPRPVVQRASFRQPPAVRCARRARAACARPRAAPLGAEISRPRGRGCASATTLGLTPRFLPTARAALSLPGPHVRAPAPCWAAQPLCGPTAVPMPLRACGSASPLRRSSASQPPTLGGAQPSLLHAAQLPPLHAPASRAGRGVALPPRPRAPLLQRPAGGASQGFVPWR